MIHHVTEKKVLILSSNVTVGSAALKFVMCIVFLHNQGDHSPESRRCEIPRQFYDISLTVHGTPAHVKCYSYHASTSVIVSGGGRNATMHDGKPK